MNCEGTCYINPLDVFVDSSLKAFSDHSQLPVLIIASTKSVFINSTSRVIMNFKIKQKAREIDARERKLKPITQRRLFWEQIDNSLFLLMKSVNIFHWGSKEEWMSEKLLCANEETKKLSYDCKMWMSGGVNKRCKQQWSLLQQRPRLNGTSSLLSQLQLYTLGSARHCTTGIFFKKENFWLTVEWKIESNLKEKFVVDKNFPIF